MADRLPQTTPRKMIQALQALGFVIIRTRGSHVFLRRRDREVLIAYHNRELTRALLFSILKRAGLTIEDVGLYL